MPIITPERAGEIRGQLTEQYGATWLHFYAEAIEAEVLANLGSLQKDAERYRFLRDTNYTRTDDDGAGPVGAIDTIVVLTSEKGDAISISVDEFDDVVDAGIAQRSAT